MQTCWDCSLTARPPGLPRHGTRSLDPSLNDPRRGALVTQGYRGSPLAKYALDFRFMDSTDQLQVNLMDQDDIRAKLPEARRIYRAKQEALEALKQDVQNFGGLVAWMAHIVGEQANALEMPPRTPESTSAISSAEAVGTPTITTTKRKDSPAQDRAIAALRRAGKPMGPSALYRYMQSQDLQLPKNPNALGAALWNATKSSRVKKTADGLYALPEWQTDQPQLQDAPQDGSAPSVEPAAGEQASRNPGGFPGRQRGSG